MRLLHLTTFLQGGAGRAITELVLAQRRAGHDVRVVASDHAPAGYGNYPIYIDKLMHAGVPVRLVDSLFERRYSANLAVVRTIDELYAAGGEPDIIHGHAAIPSLIGLMFAGLRRSPTRIVQTMHGWGVAKSQEHAATDVAVMAMVDRVVAPSRSSRDMLTLLGIAPSAVATVSYGVGDDDEVPGFRDAELIATMKARRAAGDLVVACVGTIGERKRQTLLVEAAKRTTRAVFIVCVGDGDDAGLREAVTATGMGDRVRMHGYSPSARCIAKAADVLALPSVSEGQPLSILEAFADRTVVVTSDIPELAEIVDDGVTGFRATGDGAEAFAAVLDRVAALSEDSRKAVVERAHATYRACFTVNSMVEGYGVVYRDALRLNDAARRRQAPPAA